MLAVELYAKIRRAVLIDGLSRRDAAPVHELMEARNERALRSGRLSITARQSLQSELQSSFLLTRLVHFYAALRHNSYPTLPVASATPLNRRNCWQKRRAKRTASDANFSCCYSCFRFVHRNRLRRSAFCTASTRQPAL